MSYEKAYHLMFNAATDAVEALMCLEPGKAQQILIRAQQEAEALCISAPEGVPAADQVPARADAGSK